MKMCSPQGITSIKRTDDFSTLLTKCESEAPGIDINDLFKKIAILEQDKDHL